MNRLKKISLWVAVIVAVLVIAAVLYLQSTKPYYYGAFRLNGLTGKVTVYHDTYGIPHIYGSNEEDVYRTFGYLTAQERLFQMEMLRRVSSGRLSEILGSSMIDVDRFFRMLGVRQHADSSARLFMRSGDPACRAATLAYIDGINQYIAKGKTPIEFNLIGIPKEKFTVQDIFLIVDYMSFNFEMGFRTDPLLSRLQNKLSPDYFDRLVLDYTSDQYRNPVQSTKSNVAFSGTSFNSIYAKFPVKCWTGSNAFAIAPSRSANGKSLLENDTHIGQQQPEVWFDAHLEYPGFSFYGSYLAGVPFAPLGHTRSYGWGVTMLLNDDLDFFKEKTAEGDSNTVIIRGMAERMDIHEETIHVKDSNDVRIVVRSTSHGPVCSDVMNDFEAMKPAPVSACWTLLKFPCNLLEVAYNLGHSNSMGEFKSGVSKLIAPGLNFIYADSTGNIAWYGGAKLVQRRAGVSANRILDGADSTMEWLGYYDFNRNPISENPACGYVFSCNNQPDSVDGILHPGYYLTDERALRMRELLDKKERYTLKDVQDICLDHTNPNTTRIAKALLDHVKPDAVASIPQGATVIKLLSEWNGSHNAADKAPVFYYTWLYKTLHKALSDEMGEKDFQALVKTHSIKFTTMAILTNSDAPWWDDTSTPAKETSESIITSAFKETIHEITAFAGNNPDNWRWDRMHFLEFKHPIGKIKPLDNLFNVGPIATTGGVETINNQSFTYTDKLPFTVGFGPALRRCIDFSDPENAYSVSPSGQSGNPMSKHYADQAKMYARGEFRKELMNRDSIVAISKDVMHFTGK